MKVHIITNAYVDKYRRNKLIEQAKLCELSLITPDKYDTLLYGGISSESNEFKTYILKKSRLHYKNTVGTFILRDLPKLLLELNTEIIQVESEWHSFLVQQVLYSKIRYKLKAKVIVFSWANLRLKSPKQRIIDAINKYTIPRINFFVSGNNANRNLLLSRGITKDKICILPNAGINPLLFHPLSDNEKSGLKKEIGINPNNIIIGFSGRLIEEKDINKGIRDLVTAFEKLREENNVSLLINGKGALASLLQNKKNIHHIYTPYREVGKYTAIMDILVLPSRSTDAWAEQFGRVLIEAMACKVVPVGSDSGAIPEVIGSPDNIFPEGDVMALENILRKKIMNHELLEMEKEKFFEKAKKEYFDSIIAKKYQKIYRTLI